MGGEAEGTTSAQVDEATKKVEEAPDLGEPTVPPAGTIPDEEPPAEKTEVTPEAPAPEVA